MPLNPTSAEELFRARIHREGRGDEWIERYNKAVADGLEDFKARRRVATEMGYKGPVGERKLAVESGACAPELLACPTMTFEKAMELLPDSAPEAVIWAWLRQHPALMRHYTARRQTKKSGARSPKAVMVGAADLLAAPHGRCPCKEAANMLKYFVAHPEEYMKQRAKAVSGLETEAKKDDLVEDVDLPAVREILMDMRRQVEEKAKQWNAGIAAHR